MLNAILMPYVLRANRSVISERVALLARYIGISNPSFDSFLAWIHNFKSSMKIPEDLGALGIDGSQAELVGKMAVKDPSATTNPVAFERSEYQRIFTNAVVGEDVTL